MTRRLSDWRKPREKAPQKYRKTDALETLIVVFVLVLFVISFGPQGTQERK